MKYCKAFHVDRHLLNHKYYTFKCYFQNCGMDFYVKEFLDEHQRVKGHEDESKIETYPIDIKEELVGRFRHHSDTTEASSETISSSEKSSKRKLRENPFYMCKKI